VIKYWGKRDEQLILPLNSSLSATLDQADLCTITTVMASPRLTRDRLWLNGVEESLATDRTERVLREVRKRARPELRELHVHIVSENNFPTAAGLASSASGFAALVFGLAQAFEVRETFAGELSMLARLGSGSACRSMYGGWVKWRKGARPDGLDSIAVQVCDENYWSDLEVLVCVVSARKKAVASTSGMRETVQTSGLLRARVERLVEPRCQALEQALLSRRWLDVARLTIQDSNEFHACCADTYPPIHYLRGTSKRIIRLVHALNDLHRQPLAAYTFDAGPNAVLYLPRQHVPEVLRALLHFFPPPVDPAARAAFCNRPALLEQALALPPPDLALLRRLPDLEPKPGGLQQILHTRPGPGPRVLPPSAHLIDPVTALPLPRKPSSPAPPRL
jgi:diphosphomevalonate decarboxylase